MFLNISCFQFCVASFQLLSAHCVFCTSPVFLLVCVDIVQRCVDTFHLSVTQYLRVEYGVFCWSSYMEKLTIDSRLSFPLHCFSSAESAQHLLGTLCSDTKSFGSNYCDFCRLRENLIPSCYPNAVVFCRTGTEDVDSQDPWSLLWLICFVLVQDIIVPHRHYVFEHAWGFRVRFDDFAPQNDVWSLRSGNIFHPSTRNHN